MPAAGLSHAFFPGSVMAAFAPLQRAFRRATQPCRHTPQGKLYLGDGQPVIVLPAFGRGAESTTGLRATLREAGFDAWDWGLGTDYGPAGGLGPFLQALEERLIDASENARAQVTLVGWGLSGLYARELAKRSTPLVRQVITLGTPVRPSMAAARGCAMFDKLRGGRRRADAPLLSRLRQRPPVPCTALYSQQDEQVPWELCLQPETAASENILVPGARHFELASHPLSLEVITHRLAQRPDEWMAFDHAW